VNAQFESSQDGLNSISESVSFEDGRGLLYLIFRNLSGEAVGNQKVANNHNEKISVPKPQRVLLTQEIFSRQFFTVHSVQPVSRPRFEPNASRVQV
jgi:hypothetical protein